MWEIIKMLDKNLKYVRHEIKNDGIHIQVKSRRKVLSCSKCGEESKKVHSRYNRTVQDLPIGNKKVYIEIMSRKMFCRNPNCSRKTFAESYGFVGANRVKTRRLEQEIVSIGVNMSSMATAQMLNRNIVKISGRTVRNLIKKTRQEQAEKMP